MDELVRRLRELADHPSRAWYPDTEIVRQAADALTTLTAALEGLVAAVVDLDDDGRVKDGPAMGAVAAARAALREVGRG